MQKKVTFIVLHYADRISPLLSTTISIARDKIPSCCRTVACSAHNPHICQTFRRVISRQDSVRSCPDRRVCQLELRQLQGFSWLSMPELHRAESQETLKWRVPLSHGATSHRAHSLVHCRYLKEP